MTQRGVVAAGHPATAAAGAEILRAGGNAVDAAVAAVLTSFVAEPLLTGLGAGGYLLAAGPGQPPVLLDFSVEAPGRGAAGPAAPLVPVELSFEGDAVQTFHVGASACATYGAPAGVAAAAEAFGHVPLDRLTAPAARLARDGVRLNPMQAYLFELLAGLILTSPEATRRYFVDGRPPRAGELQRDPELADALDRLGAEGAAPFYVGDIAGAVSDWVCARGGVLTRADLAEYRVVRRTPLRVDYHGREVFTNPPPSAGGSRLAYALAHVAAGRGAPGVLEIAAAIQAADRAEAAAVNPLGSTTHISVLDADGWACAVTCSNGTGSGVSVPGTGIHLNNMLGETDLAPRGAGPHPVGARLPSSMAPTVVRAGGDTGGDADGDTGGDTGGAVELVVGSAGSNRIRSALLQVVVNVVDRGLSPQEAVDAPRLHVEGGTAYAEPGIDVAALATAGLPVVPFTGPHLFFGGCQVARRDPRTGALDGGADARRGGAVVVV